MAKEKEKSPEEIYAAKLDMCITDGIVKTGKFVFADVYESITYSQFRLC